MRTFPFTRWLRRLFVDAPAPFQLRRLSEDAFRATLAEPMRRVAPDSGRPFDFWPYFDAIPTEDFAGHDCSAGRVDHVFRHPDGVLEHVLVSSEHRDIFMVLVIDRRARRVVGHRLLDLPALYGMTR